MHEHYEHLADRLERMILQLEIMVNHLQSEVNRMASTLDDVVTLTTAQTAEIQKVADAVTALKAQLVALGLDQAKIDQIVSSLTANNASLTAITTP